MLVSQFNGIWIKKRIKLSILGCKSRCLIISIVIGKVIGFNYNLVTLKRLHETFFTFCLLHFTRHVTKQLLLLNGINIRVFIMSQQRFMIVILEVLFPFCLFCILPVLVVQRIKIDVATLYKHQF